MHPVINPVARTVVSGMSFTECPRWHEDRLWFSDFYTYAVYSVREDGSDLRTEADVPGQPSGIGWLPDGRLLVVSMEDRRLLRREADGSLAVHADLSSYSQAVLNDMVVDGHGRAWVGSFGFDLMNGADIESTVLLRVDPDGTVAVAAEDLWFPNGSVLTDDGRLLVDETFGNRVTSFDVAEDGTLTGRRVWAEFAALPESRVLGEALGQLTVAPDGCGLDADGCLWIADALHGRVLRVAEGGEIRAEVAMGTGAFACMLGGSDGHTLFVCCAPDFDRTARSAAREGEIRAVSVEAAHAGRP